jgi:Tfp pilus assembly protein FimT
MKKSRSAYTLFEMLLVCAIILVLAALVAPSMMGLQGSYKVTGAVDSVRSAWAEARARAIDEGRPYRFSVEPQGSSYRVAPDHPDYWGGSQPSNDPNGAGLVLEKALPGGVRFAVNGEGAGSGPVDETLKIELDEKITSNANWSTAVIFLPDGTAREDVKIQFHLSGEKSTSIQLNGQTGDVSVEG